MFDGTNHVIYNKSIYYQRAGRPVIAKASLKNGLITANATLPHEVIHSGKVGSALIKT